MLQTEIVTDGGPGCDTVLSAGPHPYLYPKGILYFVLQKQVHNFNTRNKLKLHTPVSSLTLYQKGVYNMSIRVFNKLPENVTYLVGNKKIFILTLRQYLVRKALYSLENF